MKKLHLRKSTAGLITYFLGATLGGASTILFLKGKYRREAEAEIEEIRKVYRERLDRYKPNHKKKDISSDKPNVEVFDMKSFHSDVQNIITKERRYTSSAPEIKPVEVEEETEVESTVPYAISPDEFNTKNDYSVVFLTYYADGILVDDAGDIVSIASGYPEEDGYSALDMPEEILDHMGEYIEDVVYCRDDNLGIDYEITSDPRNYSDIPKPRGVEYEDD